ncbi:MAG: hypothetical protein ACXVPQ_04185 [Bacteroidia bacterium]
MSRDFTYKKYEALLDAILSAGYRCMPVKDYFSASVLPEKLFILRHDVDRLPFNAVELARIQRSRGVTGTYYWRIHPESYNAKAIRDVLELGHELGYHYEDLTLEKGDMKKAVSSFEKNLSHFREYYPVNTICMHGSPMTKWDNRQVWDLIKYRDYGIIAEPYYDFDFTKIFYLTDTGRHWNNKEISVRDKVNSGFSIEIRNTDDIISKITGGNLPGQLMYNIHPHRWNDNLLRWSNELVMQNMKNQVKRFLVK